MRNLENVNVDSIPNNAVIFNSSNGTKYAGIATGDYFASRAFITSDEAYHKITGHSFGWYCFEDKEIYKDSKYKFSRPSVEEWQLLFTIEQRVLCWECM